MRRILLPLYGPFALHSYGMAIALGLVLTIILMQKHPQFKRLRLEDSFAEILLVTIAAALFGGRALFLLTQPEWITSWWDMFTFWQGGLSLLGAIMGGLLALPWYLKKMNIPILPFLDLVALHIPLLQSLSRIGCFFAGCCYGRVTTFSWGVIYTDLDSVAPLGICIHPAQLYSAMLLMLIFALQYFILQKIYTKSGQMLCSYLAFMAAERFITDFWRADRIFSATTQILSTHQLIAAGICVFALIGFAWVSVKKEPA